VAQTRERGMDVVVVSRSDGTLKAKVFLDPTSHLVTAITAETLGGLNQATILAHCPYGALRFVCHHQSVVGSGPRIEIKVDELVLDPELPASLFERPAR
jgi:hypothetical protein